MTVMNQPATVAPRTPALPHATSMKLAATEYQRVAAAVAALRPDDWTRPTDCSAWNVHDLVAHIVGMARMASSPVQQRRQQKAAAKRLRGGEFIDALTAVQVEEFSPNSDERLVELMAWVGPKAARGRKFAPSFARSKTMPVAQLVGGVHETWTVGYLVDTILTRDPWMHRIDLAQATGAELDLTADHDGVLVDDVVNEWAARHARPFHLTLTGPAGGSWSNADDAGANTFELDAIEFCRSVSGRGTTPCPLSTFIPF